MAMSPSFPRVVVLQQEGIQAAFVVEYAIWWDWDIQHLYELEHVWVYVNAAGQIVRCEASWHGGFHIMEDNGKPTHEGDHAIVYSEPGKHAFAPTPAWFTADPTRSDDVTNAQAGIGGLHITPLFQGILQSSPLVDRLAQDYLVRHAFTPSYTFSTRFTFEPRQLVPWPELCTCIPKRINSWINKLQDAAQPDPE